MNDYKLEVPVALFFFNRPDSEKKVFERVREAKPQTLLLVSDGPRNEDDLEKVEKTRRYVEEHIDWECDVRKNYSDVNLGCRGRMSTGITWALEQTGMAILLEDDIVPSPDFFRFCQEMLYRYEDDERIMMVSGYKAMPDYPCEHSYFFSRDYPIWGWATWKRAWDLYDVDIKSWPHHKENRSFEKTIFPEQFYEQKALEYDKVWDHSYDTWDYQWNYCCIVNHGLGIIPSVNLIKNIGFNMEATHTVSQEAYSRGEPGRLSFPLTHPSEMMPDYTYDLAHMKKMAGGGRFVSKLKNAVHKTFSR